MNRINMITIWAAVSLMTVITGCKKEETTDAMPAKERLTVGNGEVRFSATETGQEVPVIGDCHWRISYDKNGWDDLIVQPSEGNGNGTLIITSQQNTTTAERTATVTLTSDGGLVQRIQIIQTLAGAALNVSTREITFVPEPTVSQELMQTLTVSSNTDWHIAGHEAAPWLHLDVTQGGAGVQVVNITCDEIQDDADRTATLTVISSSNSHEVTVTQQGKTDISLSVSTDNLPYFVAVGGTQTVQITSNGAWRVLVPQISRRWLHVTPEQGVGNGQLTITCDAYPNSERTRLSVVAVTAGTRELKQCDIQVQQSSALYPEVDDLEVDEASIDRTSAMLSFSYQSSFAPTDYGLCYSTTHQEPTVSDQVLSLGASAATSGTVRTRLTELDRGTYYVRAYVISPVTPIRPVYSSRVITFSVEGNLIIPSEGDNTEPSVN